MRTETSSSGKKRKRRLVPLLIGLLLFAPFAYCSLVHVYGPYYGRVVDLETQESITGAVVLVWFFFETIGIAQDGTSRFVDAAEAVTDSGGRFRIPARVEFNQGWLGYWDTDAMVRVFSPGYGCYPLHKDARPHFTPGYSLPAGTDVLVELPKLTERSDRLESTHCDPDLVVSCSRTPGLVQAVNRERRFLGLDELRCPKR